MERIIPDDLNAGLPLILCALGVLMLPLRWILGLIIAILCHEGGHLLALYLLGIPVMGIQGSLTGFRIVTYELTPGQEFLAAFAGPLFSFLLLLIRNIFPELAICGMVQGLFNLFPIYPSDGGRMLSAVLCKLTPERRNRILRTTGLVFLIILATSTIFLIRGCTAGVCAVLAVVFWTRFRNIPCKDAAKEVK